MDTASTSDAVTFITYVQALKRKIKAFEKQVDVSESETACWIFQGWKSSMHRKWLFTSLPFFFSLQCFLFVYLIRHPFNLIGKSDLAGKGMTDREAWHEGSMSRLSLSADVIIAVAVDTVNNAVMESVWLVNSSCPVLTTVRGAVKVRCVGFLPPISHTLLPSQLITTRVAFTGRKASHAWLQNDHAVLQWH